MCAGTGTARGSCGCAEPQIPRILHQLGKGHLLNSAGIGILGNECTGSSTLNNTTNGNKAEIAF